MKKQLLVLLPSLVLFVVTFAFAKNGGDIKIGLDLAGKHKVSALGLSGTENVNTGISFSSEYIAPVNDNLEIGAGVTLQFPREQKNFEGAFNFIPIYGLIRIYPDYTDIKPYLLGQFGYNFFNGDNNYTGDNPLTGGIYYGIGAGLVFKNNILVEMLYSVNNGSAELSGVDFDVKYSKLCLSLGYNF